MGIPRPTGRQMPVSDSSREPATAHQLPQATREQTAAEIVLATDQQLGRATGAQTAKEAAEAIALETEVCRQARMAAPEEAPLAALRAAVTPHARAVRGVRQVWEARAVVRVVAVGGGNQ